MARLSSSGGSSSDITAINLNRLLARLQKTLLRPDSATERRLRSSSYERRKVNANLGYAKVLLLQLEQDSLNIRVQSKKQDVQSELLQKRDVILRLNERLEELDSLGDLPDDDTSEGEDLLGEDTPSDDIDDQQPSPSDSHIFASSSVSSAAGAIDHDQPYPAQLTSPSTSSHDRDRDDLFTSSAGLRSRHNPNISTTVTQDTGVSTSSSTSRPAEDTSTITAAEESLLSYQRHEQEELTTSLLSMAQQLKLSSQSFSQSLESEKGVLDAATEGLDKNTSGLEAASKKMGVLRRMLEGKGWLGRMMMYVWIFGLMIVAVLIVFVGPKLRF